LTIKRAQEREITVSQMWSKEYWVKKRAVDLYVYRKREGAPAAGQSKPVLFLIHGSSLSAIPSYDLHIAGHNDYSVMDAFADLGFDVWTMDHEGYGRSSRTDGNSDVACAVEDLKLAMPLVTRETGRAKAIFFGQSGGALRAAAFAQACPDMVERLVLDGFVWTGKGSPTLAKRAERLAEWRANPTRKVDRAFFQTIFNRDHPAFGDPLVAEKWADYEMALGDTFPTGTYLDMSANLPLIDPKKVTCPVQIIRGEYDGIASDDDLIEFFRLLPNKDKQFCMMAGQAHVGPQAVNRHRFMQVMRSFVTMPERRDVLASKV
jgi:pimeloyl-ACP methyl ester carboxylesterase